MSCLEELVDMVEDATYLIQEFDIEIQELQEGA